MRLRSYILISIAVIIGIILIVGVYKFNYIASLLGYYPKAEITISNDVIYFKGETERGNYKSLLAAVSKHKNVNFKKIIINSGGGDTVYGRKIGEFIFDNQLDVEVEEICFSSCANYIFPTGKTKYIQKDAFVGWHGSEFQGLLLKDKNQTFEEYVKEVLKDALTEAGFYNETTLEREYQRAMKSLAEESQFYEKIKTSNALPLFGLDIYPEDGQHMGWFYSIEDMGKFGLNNVVYLGNENEYPIFQEEYRGALFQAVYDPQKVEEIELAISEFMASR